MSVICVMCSEGSCSCCGSRYSSRSILGYGVCCCGGCSGLASVLCVLDGRFVFVGDFVLFVVVVVIFCVVWWVGFGYVVSVFVGSSRKAGVFAR